MRKRPAIVFFLALLFWELLDVYGRLDFLAAKLREMGPVGVFLAVALISRGLRLALIAVGLVMTLRRNEADAQRQQRTQRSSESNGELTITAKELAALYKQHTTYQADKLFAVYRGKPMSVSVKVRDVDSNLSGGVSLLTSDDEGISISLDFPASRRALVEHTRRGDRLRVHGRVHSVTALGVVYLTDCVTVSACASASGDSSAEA